LFVGLVRGSDGWEPPEEPAPVPAPRRTWDVPWRELAWLGLLFALLLVSPTVSRHLGGLAGYLVLLLAVGLGFSRLARFCSGQYWRGLRDYQS
jgi:hypothetical protein